MGTLNRRTLPAAFKALREYIDTQISAWGADVGDVKMSAASSVPSGWLLCDGSSLLRTDYPALFAAIGTTYGSVDGTHFTLPDWTNSFPRGNTRGTGGGADTHAHTSAAHTHTSAAHSHGLSNNGWARIVIPGSTRLDMQTKSGVASWTSTDSLTGVGTYSSTGTNRGAGAVLAGATDSTTPADTGSTTPGDTGSSSNVPVYTGVAFIIKT